MEISKVCVVGAGLMGRQIALHTALYSCEVWLTDSNTEILEDVKKWAESYLDGRVKKGKIDEQKASEAKANFHVSDSLKEAATDSDLIIEAIIEDEQIKREFFKELSGYIKPTTIIATNSSRMVSSLFIDCVNDASRLANLHYFNPALSMKLVEIVQGEHTSEETMKTLTEFCENTGKKPVRINKEIDGFIVNNILNSLVETACRLVEEGYCTYEDADIACQFGLNHPMGPFKIMDFSGIDLVYLQKKREYEMTGKKVPMYDTFEKMYEEKNWGMKTGKGFYEY